MANTDPIKIISADEALAQQIANFNPEFVPVQRTGTLNKYDEGLRPGNINRQDLRSRNQGALKALTNGLGQMLLNVQGETMATPGYLLSLFAPVEKMNEGFLGFFTEIADNSREFGEEFMPIYTSQATDQAVFAPLNSEWWAQSAAQFGPTIALAATAFMTEGATTPRLLAGLGRLGKVSSAAAKAHAALKPGSAAYKAFRGINATVS